MPMLLSFMAHHCLKTPQEWSWLWKSAEKTWGVTFFDTPNPFLENPKIPLSWKKLVNGWKRSLMLWLFCMERELSTETSNWKTSWYETNVSFYCHLNPLFVSNVLDWFHEWLASAYHLLILKLGLFMWEAKHDKSGLSLKSPIEK